MIEFNGELSDTVKKQFIQLFRRGHIFIGLFIVPIMTLFFAPMLYEVSNSIGEFLLYFFSPYIALVILVTIYCLVPYGKKEVKNLVSPAFVQISESKIHYKLPSEEELFDISEVKKVIDYGEFYMIKFYFNAGRRCPCQKDLITQGTIEQFEEIFKDKLVRKPKQKASQTNNISTHKSDIDNKEVIQDDNPVSQDKI